MVLDLNWRIYEFDGLITKVFGGRSNIKVMSLVSFNETHISLIHQPDSRSSRGSTYVAHNHFHTLITVTYSVEIASIISMPRISSHNFKNSIA